MRTYEIRGKGLDTLTLVERPVPQPGPGQVLVRMHAASLNYRDLLIATGRYGRGELRYPLVPLSDGAGEVVDIGPGVTRLQPNDRVAGAFFQKWVDGPFDAGKAASALGGAIDGVLAEYVVLDEAAAVPVPSTLSFTQAATLPCAGVTAWNAVVSQGRLQPGQTLLTLGTGGVSIFALQIGKALGARVIITSSSDEKLKKARELGADEGVNYRTTPDWAKRVRELTGGRGVDHVVEVGGGGTLEQSIKAVRPAGTVSIIGALAGAKSELNLLPVLMQNIRLQGVFVGHRESFEALCAAVETNRIQPVVDRSFCFDEARAAFEHMQSGSHFGKLCLDFAG
jgi:NADPH:quinone reductase-like Zn-dependent oxidoreductase